MGIQWRSSTVIVRTLEVLGGLFVGAMIFFFVLYKAPPFIDVTEISVKGDYVFVERTIRGVTEANWSVDVYNDKQGNVCRGNSPGSHTYKDSPEKVVEFDIDTYVGDPECIENLIIGNKYTMVIAWIPVSEDVDPVYYWTYFTYTGSELPNNT